MQTIKQSDPRATHRRVFFTAVDTTSLLTRLQSSDMGTFALKLTKNGATPITPAAATPTQVDATAQKGVFYAELTTADIDTPGFYVLRVQNTGGTKTMEVREIAFHVASAAFAVVAAGLNTTSFTSTRSETTDNYWKDVYLNVLTGVCTGAGGKKVGSYTGSSKMFTLAGGLAFTDTLSPGDILEIVNR